MKLLTVPQAHEVYAASRAAQRCGGLHLRFAFYSAACGEVRVFWENGGMVIVEPTTQDTTIERYRTLDAFQAEYLR